MSRTGFERSLVAWGLLAVLLLPAVTARAAGGIGTPALSVQTLVLTPAGVNGSDAFIQSLNPLWNYGANASLVVGPNQTTGGLSRALLSFNLSAVPGNATVLSASLAAYQSGGPLGTVQVRPALSSWTEGVGGHSWVVVPVTVTETAGVNRTLEPVEVTVPFLPNAITTPARDLRVYGLAGEVPSQVYGYTYSNGILVSARLFFDVSVDAYQSRTFDIVYSTNGTAVPAYRTQTWGSSALWTYGPTGGGASGATVADIDHDGHLEIVFGGTNGTVYCLTDRGTLKWATPVSPGASIPFTPQVADVDRSGKMSILVSTNAPSVVRLNSSGAIVWTYNSPATLFTTPTLVDMNGDGVLDALVGSNNKNIAVINGKTGALLTSLNVPIAGYTATVADIDRSGKPEILVDGDDKLVHAFALNGTQLWASAPAGTSFVEGSIAFGDVNGDGVPEIVTGDASNNGLEFALYASNGSTAWTATLPTYRFGGQTIADLGGGHLSVFVPTSSGPFYDLSGKDGTTVWSFNAGTTEAGSPVVADLAQAGTPQILLLEGGSVDVLNPSGLLVHAWSVAPANLNLRSSQYPMTSPALADLTGNGTLDVLVPTANGLSAFATGGLDHDWRTWGYNTNHTQRFLDGASGTGASFLKATLGSAVVHPASGVSWDYRDGLVPWNSGGGDLGLPVANATAAGAWVSWNITGLVQAWVTAPATNHGFALAESAEVTGVQQVFASADTTNASLRPRLTLTYALGLSPAGPRIVGRIPDLSIPENGPPFSLDLAPYAADNATPLTLLRWNVTGYESQVVAITGLNTPGGLVLTLIPQAGRYGNALVTYWLTDPQGRYAAQQAWINVTFVDQPPTFAPPLVLYVHYNVSYVFDFGPYISDPDTPRSRLVLESNDTAHTTVSGFNVSFLYPSADLGQWHFVRLTVSDGTYNVSQSIAIDVTSDNPPVVKAQIPDQTLWEGTTKTDAFNLTGYFTDPNNDSLFFSYGYNHLAITIHTNESVDIGAPSGWWGQESVTFRATDPTGAIAEDSVLVTVLHVDQPPAIGPVPDLVVHYDSPYSFNLDPYLSDPDTPVATLTVTTSDPTHVTASGDLLTFYYPIAFNNTVQNVTILVSDGTFTVNKTIRVTIGSDWPPVVRAKMPDVSFPEGSSLLGAYNLSSYFADPEGGVLYWSSGEVHVIVSIRSNGSVDLSAVPLWHGTERVTFRATDSFGALQEDSVWITVTPVDHAPYFLPVPRQLLNVTTAYLPLTPYLRDPDTNASELFLTGTNSSHATVIGQGILLHFTADTTVAIQVTVSDGNLTNTTTIVVVVDLVVPPPQVTEIVPTWIYWIPLPLAIAGVGAFLLYRRRQLEWAFLVTNHGLLVGSVSRRGEGSIDTDLMTGMLTTIMDFAKTSFSDERERELEGLELGEKRVAIVRGDLAYLAVVYRGKTPGGLLRIMRSLLAKIETVHRSDLGGVIDSARLGDVPLLLNRLVTRGNLPFVRFDVPRDGTPAGRT